MSTIQALDEQNEVTSLGLPLGAFPWHLRIQWLQPDSRLHLQEADSGQNEVYDPKKVASQPAVLPSCLLLVSGLFTWVVGVEVAVIFVILALCGVVRRFCRSHYTSSAYGRFQNQEKNLAINNESIL